MSVASLSVESFLRKVKPMSADERQAQREQIAKRAAARFARGSVRAMNGNVLYKEDIERHKQDGAKRVRERQDR